MTTERDALRISAETDALSRLAFADWLEEHNEEQEAKVYRIAANIGNVYYAVESLFGWPEGTCGGIGFWPHRALHMTDVDYSRLVLTTVLCHEKRLDKEAKAILQRQEWERQAAEGNVDALLALPMARLAIKTLVKGSRSGVRVTDYTSSRKAVSEAKAKMAARDRRKADRSVVKDLESATAGKYRAMWIDKLKKQAISMGRQYHRTVKKLYTSSRADVVYGNGGKEGYDAEAYSKTYNRRYGGAKYKNAGARLDNEEKPTCIILENFRGIEVARLPLPRPVPKTREDV